MREIERTTRYIRFVKIAEKAKTKVWVVENNSSGGQLGIIEWYASWRQYCFSPAEGTIFNNSCLKDIDTFLSLRNAEPRV
jgi:hypothetical protein